MLPESTRASLRMLSAAVLLVLLIACVNVANLLLIRSESRQRELGVRVAMGASRGRLLPVFLGESLILALLGGGLGIVLAWSAVPALSALFGDTIPRSDDIGVDTAVLGFALALSGLTGLVVGAFPALRTDVRKLAGPLREGTRSVSRSGHRIRRALVVVEVALSVVLVAAAGLFVKSSWRLSQIDHGLEEPEQVLIAHMVLSPADYDGPASWDAFFDEVVAATEALPGVVSVGTTSRLPLHGGYNVTDMCAYDDRERVSHFVELRYVSTGFFDAMGIELVAGRALEAADGDAPGNVVATEELARQLFGTPQAAVGEAIIAGHWENPVRIVGVVSDVRDLGLLRAAPPGIYYVYGPETNHGYGGILTVRTAGDPMDVLPRVRDVVYRLDPTVPLYDIRLLSDVVARTVGTQRFSTVLFGLFAGLALVLGAVGIYGVVAAMVSERTREMGVRMALGARAREVVRMVLGSGVRLTALGLVIGVVGAVGAARLLERLLHEVDPGDPLVHGTVAALLLGVAVVACWVPAWRASRVDPVQALRHE